MIYQDSFIQRAGSRKSGDVFFISQERVGKETICYVWFGKHNAVGESTVAVWKVKVK